jgi:hypothetical protein
MLRVGELLAGKLAEGDLSRLDFFRLRGSGIGGRGQLLEQAQPKRVFRDELQGRERQDDVGAAERGRGEIHWPHHLCSGQGRSTGAAARWPPAPGGGDEG